LYPDNLPAFGGLQHQRRAAVAGQSIALMRQHAGLRPAGDDAVLMGIKHVEMIFRIARLIYLAVGRFQGGGQGVFVTGKQRQRGDPRRRITQHHQTKIPRGGRRRHDPAIAVGFQPPSQ